MLQCLFLYFQLFYISNHAVYLILGCPASCGLSEKFSLGAKNVNINILYYEFAERIKRFQKEPRERHELSRQPSTVYYLAFFNHVISLTILKFNVENDITIDILKYLNADNIKRLIPKIGMQILFREKLKAHMNQNVDVRNCILSKLQCPLSSNISFIHNMF